MAVSQQPKIVTYTADVSICSQICRLAIQEHQLHDARDVHVDIEHAMDNYEAWFVRMQPTMTVPVMQYNEHFIGDSKDILYFLAEQHPDAGLYPEAARTQIDQFVDAFYASFGAIGIFTFGNLQARSEALRQFIKVGKTDVTLRKLQALVDDPDLGAIAQAKLEQVAKRDFGRLSDATLLARADKAIEGLLETMDRLLSEGRAFLCSSAYALADIVGTALLARIHFIKETSIFTPLVHEYWDRVRARPSFTAANVCATWESTLMAKQFAEFAGRG